MLGREVLVSELIREIDKDRIFYDESEGGVTFSGGEPLVQADFLLACLRSCRRREYNTAVDTCGCAPLETILEVAAETDLFLYDLKLMDAARHKRYVGGDSERILGNLRALCTRGGVIWIRFPLIPGINDDEANLEAVGSLVRSLAGPPPVYVLPYHRIGSDKYSRIGTRYELYGIESPNGEQVADVASLLRSFGLTVEIGG
jgi:pyruvate formate lyase activating enzyme